VKDAALALPFDQYQRYRLVADLLERIRGGGRQLTVLDVGGRTAVLRGFVEGARITLVDVEPSGERGLVLGDGGHLPFKDASFDVVCAFDTLEHVPPQFRTAFVAECRRVARRVVILIGPYEHPRVVEAEELLQRFLERKLGERHRYLDEHRHHGLPERAAVERQLRELGGSVASIGHANLDRWLVLQCMSMYMDYDPALRPLAADFQRFYNAELYASDHAEPVYRHAVVASFDGRPIELGGLLAPPRAPTEALRTTFDLGAELVHFDRERASWRAERKEFQMAVAALESRISGLTEHAARLEEAHAADQEGIAALRADIERERVGLAATIATLQADLASHRDALSQAHGPESEHQRVIAELEQRITAFEAERETLRADLEGHKLALADVRADLEGHRKALAEARTILAQQADALAQSQAEAAAARDRGAELERSMAAMDVELRKTLSFASGLEQSFAERELVYDALRAELRSRWRNLLRVVAPPR
jgi:SAM-dependent methyltransferase